MNRMLRQIEVLHTKFGMRAADVPFSPDEKEFRRVCLQEELTEYVEAKTPADELDALVDLVVFALGTAERQGYLGIFEEAFDRVMIANMAKIVGPNKKRGSWAIDLKKPKGWRPPNFDDLFETAVKKQVYGESPTGVDKTRKERESVYGSFGENSRITQSLMRVLQTSASYAQLSDAHVEAFHMIFHKMARVVCGNPNYVDNVHDMAGYARCLEEDMLGGSND